MNLPDLESFGNAGLCSSGKGSRFTTSSNAGIGIKVNGVSSLGASELPGGDIAASVAGVGYGTAIRRVSMSIISALCCLMPARTSGDMVPGAALNFISSTSSTERRSRVAPTVSISDRILSALKM